MVEGGEWSRESHELRKRKSRGYKDVNALHRVGGCSTAMNALVWPKSWAEANNIVSMGADRCSSTMGMPRKVLKFQEASLVTRLRCVFMVEGASRGTV